MRFVQLSDIHFVKDAGDPRELDGELRVGCVNQIAQLNKQTSIDAVLVCGDVAFGGQIGEYQRASAFLRDLTSRIGLKNENVFVVPGNHDIDRAITGTEAQAALRTGLRKGSDAEREAQLGDALRDTADAAFLFEPLANYVSFAQGFDCPTSPHSPHWDFSMVSDGVEVCLRGINTVLVSHALDDTQDQRLLLGRFQVPDEPTESRLNVTLAHHPREWVHDAKRIWKRLERRSGLLITGHTHAYEFLPTDAGGWLRAGALQPNRRETEWIPHFSIVDLEVRSEQWTIRVQPWAWDDDEGKFFEQPVEEISRPRAGDARLVSPAREADIRHATNMRRLRIRLGALAPSEILTVVSSALAAPFEHALTEPPATLARVGVELAASKSRLAALWDEINGLRAVHESNPFT